MMTTLAEGLQQELTRNRELLKVYEEIGAAGVFGKAGIAQKIRAAENAIAVGDVVAMIGCYQALKDSK